MSGISTHVLDTALGRPAQGLMVRLAVERPQGFVLLAKQITDAQGRIADLLGNAPLEVATYRLHFDTDGYLRSVQQTPFFPQVEILFRVSDASSHYHVPLLLSPFGYSTYRGS
jgi:5-hydroxyisourate hydrolase